MPTYRVDFVDLGNDVYYTEYLERDGDEAAVEEARLLNANGIGAGFDVWHEKRPVHQQRNECLVAARQKAGIDQVG